MRSQYGKEEILKIDYHFTLILAFAALCPLSIHAQQSEARPANMDTIPVLEYQEAKEYEIGGIKVTGAFYSDETAIKSVAGLQEGAKIEVPGNDIPRAMRALWKLRLFTDVQIIQEKTIGDHIFLNIHLQERPRLSRYSYKGIKKSLEEDLNDVVKPFLIKGQIVTEDTKLNARRAILKELRSRGYLDATVDVRTIEDEQLVNAVRIDFIVDRNERVKIAELSFSGNEELKDKKIRKQMSNTKRKGRIFSKSKLVRDEYEQDKKDIVAFYNTLGFRDMEIVEDTMWRDDKGDLHIQMIVDEGDKYYFRDISWKGNSIHSDDRLTQILGIKKGDIYNADLLEQRLRFSLDGRDVSSLYLDDGYLFFNVDPIEVAVENDSIDLEMRIFEGAQATIDKVVIRGNDRTHEHVIRRELRTKPGQKFSRSDIIRSQREIINLGYFNPETIQMNTPVDQARGTVDIEYIVEERPADQLELSAGWGGFGTSKVIGTLGVSFNNFSLRNVFNKTAWRPLPQGDGQKLSLRAQTNGDFYQSYNFSFTEPWLGGKKPNSFTLGGVLTKFNNEIFGGGQLSIGRIFTGIGTHLKWPDDNFIGNLQLNVENIKLNNYSTGDFVDPRGGQIISNGNFNNLSLQFTLARSSVYEPIFPRSGSKVSLTGKLTPPYSSLGLREDLDFNNPQELYKWVEYHKWRVDFEWYAPVIGKLVLKADAKLGFLGFYNKDIGLAPFERFELGGDGLSNQRFGVTGKDIFALRGYEVEDLPANNLGGATIFDKFTVELRFPLSLNPSSTIYVLSFLQGGNSWTSFDQFNPFDMKRSAGVGMRVFLPMFGLLGFDYGFGFDKPELVNTGAKWSDFGKFSIILGFEPE